MGAEAVDHEMLGRCVNSRASRGHDISRRAILALPECRRGYHRRDAEAARRFLLRREEAYVERRPSISSAICSRKSGNRAFSPRGGLSSGRCRALDAHRDFTRRHGSHISREIAMRVATTPSYRFQGVMSSITFENLAITGQLALL